MLLPGITLQWTGSTQPRCVTSKVFVMKVLLYNFISLQAHCHYVVLRVSLGTVQNADVCPANKDILYALCYLYAMFGIVQPSGEFVLVRD